MAEPRRTASADEPAGPAEHLTGEPTPPGTWPTYPGGTDALPGVAEPAPARRRRWPWAVAAAVVALVALVWVGVRGAPVPLVLQPQQQWPIAPAQWQRVDASLTHGLVVVGGSAEADGLVLTQSGLVATSYTRIVGDTPEDFPFGVVADGQDGVQATMVAADRAADVAILQAAGFSPASVVTPGTPVQVGETLTLLDDQGGRQPVVGVAVVVTATDQTCSRAGSSARPTGFRFSLAVATAEPGAALVRADGTLVGMYYGGDDASHHCAIPVADVLRVARAAGYGG